MIRILLLCYVLGTMLSATEVPDGFSAQVHKAASTYDKELATVVKDSLKKISKEHQKHVRTYEKIEKSMVNAGEVNGLRALQQRLRILQSSKERKTLFGNDNEDQQKIDINSLPSKAKTLEHTYTNKIGKLLKECNEDFIECRFDFVDDLKKERKRLVKASDIDGAESLQTFIDTIMLLSYDKELSEIRTNAQLLNDNQAKEPLAKTTAEKKMSDEAKTTKGPTIQSSKGLFIPPANFWAPYKLHWAQLNLTDVSGKRKIIGIKPEFLELYNTGKLNGLDLREYFKEKIPDGYQFETLSVSINNGLRWADPGYLGASIKYLRTGAMSQELRDRVIKHITSGQRSAINVD